MLWNEYEDLINKGANAGVNGNGLGNGSAALSQAPSVYAPPTARQAYTPQGFQYPPPAQAQAGLPSDEEIIMEVRNILASANLASITKKSVREQLSGFFNVDLSSRKDFINEVIEAILQGRM